ncbi:uncharacterized protein [Acropora muricata]|uniref:uncharacterized protein n=1 Tax=Acropora muricata TaxID=159855 RepID=UPI0034E48B79
MSPLSPGVPQGQNRPRVLVARNRQESRLSVRRDLQFNSSSRESRGEETSPVFPLINCSPGQSGSQQVTRHSSMSCMTTPLDTPQQASRPGELQRQLHGLQRQIATLSEKIDRLQDSTRSTTSTQGVKTSRTDEKLPRDMVACVHKIVAKLKEKDPPVEWTLDSNNSFNDDVNCEVSRMIERGVQATSAFKEADPVLLERAIRTYFKTLKARRRRTEVSVRRSALPEVKNKQEESVVLARRNQRRHNKLKGRKTTLRQSAYSMEKKKQTAGSHEIRIHVTRRECF